MRPNAVSFSGKSDGFAAMNRRVDAAHFFSGQNLVQHAILQPESRRLLAQRIEFERLVELLIGLAQIGRPSPVSSSFLTSSLSARACCIRSTADLLRVLVRSGAGRRNQHDRDRDRPGAARFLARRVSPTPAARRHPVRTRRRATSARARARLGRARQGWVRVERWLGALSQAAPARVPTAARPGANGFGRSERRCCHRLGDGQRAARRGGVATRRRARAAARAAAAASGPWAAPAARTAR